ncbi:murein L,D-transpeptidase catalytic domain family protein [Legionella taurinensis]|uniref:Murein L,D-transpeptidase catalytic domain family protein n=1 Tax=Legionella taurinensis TaxID=70611 RepID=A0A3A5LF04_9GAMM|nr:murein L,D-transpeptidase catalytic domain family protein [Legionella taurinensis]RJT46935.1 hypothetical protein D6J04_07860 [Legionella taurinensis]RJT66864.1 hypothetical protein D6J03_09245 [Legionella taurinensis]STY25413.1 Uncharacterised protein [Legionella taurinensis]
MRKSLLLLLAVTFPCFSLTPLQFLKERTTPAEEPVLSEVISVINNQPPINGHTLQSIHALLRQQSPHLSEAVINKVLTTLKCLDTYHIEHNPVLTIIDYSLPSSEKRLWVFDLSTNQLLFHTYVSHGIRSGTLLTQYFSNQYDSKASSIGVYKTEQAYYGREGLSLRLAGLDQGFNDNAIGRYLVMHSGWYVDEDFIKKYGRAGRSWGCPALPMHLAKPIIDTIKDNSLMVIYYPSDNWFLKSKFLNCDNLSPVRRSAIQTVEENLLPPKHETRDGILFVDLNKNNQREENEPIVVITADNYLRFFHRPPPLERMLRRQIDRIEYIALSQDEFTTLLGNTQDPLPDFSHFYFVIPEVKRLRGYYITEMKLLTLGKIKTISKRDDSGENPGTDDYLISFDNRPAATLKTTAHFIRWLGL